MNELNGFFFITNLCVVLLIGALLPVMPFLTRKSFLFGVKVPPDAQATAEAKALKRGYIIMTAIGAALVLGFSIAQYVLAPHYTAVAVLYVPFILIAVQLVVFVPCHKKALALKAEKGWHVPALSFTDTKTLFTRGNLSAIPRVWYVLSCLVIFVSIVLTLVKYPDLPDPFPTHYGFDMQPDAWRPKTLGVVMIGPIFNIAMTAIMWLGSVVTEKTKLQIDHNEPAKSFAQHKKYRRLMGHGLGICALGIALMFGVLSLVDLFPAFKPPLSAIMMFVIVPCIPVVAISIRAGQGGVLLKVSEAELTAATGGETGSHTVSDDRFWKWGMFYYNPDDPACFVGDRFGSGLGFNYARRPVQIGMALLLLALVATYIFATPLLLSLF